MQSATSSRGERRGERWSSVNAALAHGSQPASGQRPAGTPHTTHLLWRAKGKRVVLVLLRRIAIRSNLPCSRRITASRQEHGRMVYEDEMGLLDLPLPRLVGRHQVENAGVAIATLRHANRGWGEDAAIEKGLADVEWPARLQRLHKGPLVESAPRGAEIWLDGGHNPHGAEAVSRTMADMEEHGERPLYLICAMLANKDAVGYLRTKYGL